MPRKKGQWKRKKGSTATPVTSVGDSTARKTPPDSPSPSPTPSESPPLELDLSALPEPLDPAVDQLDTGYLLLLLDAKDVTQEERIQYALAALDRSKQEAVAEAQRLKRAVRKSKLNPNAA